ncbi:Histone acetyltransferase (MYST family) [Phaffia rhodozyma]|uniref:Histone acetyltransferase n=1 Tax=Phaffia rhodozyma TaxID=264483 RepID=A0A0F7SE41_PHARH|nr:Histone acetyltransferase (MYST family) [Phaffia rhodozyma]
MPEDPYSDQDAIGELEEEDDEYDTYDGMYNGDIHRPTSLVESFIDPSLRDPPIDQPEKALHSVEEPATGFPAVDPDFHLGFHDQALVQESTTPLSILSNEHLSEQYPSEYPASVASPATDVSNEDVSSSSTHHRPKRSTSVLNGTYIIPKALPKGKEKMVEKPLLKQTTASSSASIKKKSTGSDFGSGVSSRDSSIVRINAGDAKVERIRKPPIPKAIPDIDCSFCGGDDQMNKAGIPEDMISCHLCGRSGHLSCLRMENKELIDTVRRYEWMCIECKSCEICGVKGDDSKILFCDKCDRGYHCDCLTPPLKRPPKDDWVCPPCRPKKKHHKIVNEDTPARSIILHTSGSTPSTSTNTPTGPRPRGRPRLNTTNTTTPPPPTILRLNLGAVSRASGAALRLTFKRPNDEGLDDDDRENGESESEEDEEEDEAELYSFGSILSEAEAESSWSIPDKWDRELFTSIESRLKARSRAALSISHVDSGASVSNNTPSSYNQYLHRSFRDRAMAASQPLNMPSTSWVSGNGLSAEDTVPLERVKKMRFGPYELDTWYDPPYPEEYTMVPEGRLFICEFCLQYMGDKRVWEYHRARCHTYHPPGEEIYRDGPVSVFEVDGRKSKLYCQNLCMMAKMFIDHKTLYYDVEPFLFYVLTTKNRGVSRFVGYFSKEKSSPLNFNVSCILTLPFHQRNGWGNFLIDFSYLLSKKEGRVGSPEKPLSDLGLLSYTRYWTISVFNFLRTAQKPLSIRTISRATSLTPEDIIYVLKAYNMITIHIDASSGEASHHMRVKLPQRQIDRSHLGLHGQLSDAIKENQALSIPYDYDISWDPEVVERYLNDIERKRWATIQPSCLRWTPFIPERGRRKRKKKAGPPPPSDAIELSPRKASNGAPTEKNELNGVSNNITRSLALATHSGYHTHPSASLQTVPTQVVLSDSLAINPTEHPTSIRAST